jgi:hypothetical protein
MFGLFAKLFWYTEVQSFYWFWLIIGLHAVYCVYSMECFKLCWYDDILKLPFGGKKHPSHEIQRSEFYHVFNKVIKWSNRAIFLGLLIWFVLDPNIPLPDIHPIFFAVFYVVVELTTTLGMSVADNVDKPFTWFMHLNFMGAYTFYPMVHIVVEELKRTTDPRESNVSFFWLGCLCVIHTLIISNIIFAFNVLKLHQQP